jgi:hypothetical protein
MNFCAAWSFLVLDEFVFAMATDTNRPRMITEITDALSQLLGRDVRVKPIKSAEPTELCVRYVDGAGDLVSAWTIERSLAWSLGGALIMIPRAIVDEAISRGVDDSDLQANFLEVVNVLATTAANVLNRRAVLESVTSELDVLMRTVRQIRAAGGRWSVLELEVDGYPGGKIAVSLVTDDAD